MTAGGRRSTAAHRKAGKTLAARKRARGGPVVNVGTGPVVKPTPRKFPDPEPPPITVTTYAPAVEPGWVSEHHRASCTACGWEGTDWIGREHAEGQGALHLDRYCPEPLP
jgi:hypothetical protein